MTIDDSRLPHALVQALLALILSGLILLVIYFALFALPRADGVTGSLELPGRALELIVGRGAVHGDALEITGYESQEGLQHAVAVWRGVVQADEQPLLVYRLRWIGPAATVKFTWRTAEDPATVHSTPLYRDDVGPQTVYLGDVPAWSGTVVEVGLYVVAWQPENRIEVQSLRLDPSRPGGRLESHLTNWTAFRGWSNSSINFLLPSPRERDLSPLPAIAGWGALACVLLFLGARLRRQVARPAAYGLALLVPWIMVDLFWQIELDAQLVETRNRFAGKSLYDKHMADEDAYIYRYIQRLRRRHLPEEPARIIISHPAWGHNHERLRAQYYLLPHNVFNFGNGPRAEAIHPGDYVLLLGDTQEPAYKREDGYLVWGRGFRVPAKLLDNHVRGRLFQVTGTAEVGS